MRSVGVSFLAAHRVFRSLSRLLLSPLTSSLPCKQGSNRRVGFCESCRAYLYITQHDGLVKYLLDRNGAQRGPKLNSWCEQKSGVPQILGKYKEIGSVDFEGSGEQGVFSKEKMK